MSIVHSSFIAVIYPYNNMLSFGCTTFCLLMHQLMDVWVVYNFLSIVNNTLMNMHIYILDRHMFLILLDRYLGMKLLGCMVNLIFF